MSQRVKRHRIIGIIRHEIPHPAMRQRGENEIMQEFDDMRQDIIAYRKALKDIAQFPIGQDPVMSLNTYTAIANNALMEGYPYEDEGY